MKHWIILHRDYGQLGNRLHTHANALAWCIENNVNLINLSFKQYSPWFSSQKRGSVESLISNESMLTDLLNYKIFWKFFDRLFRSDKWLRRACRVFKIIQRDDDQAIWENELQELFESRPKKRFTLVRAWNLCCPDLVSKYQKELREIFTPKPQFTESVQLEIVELRKKYDCLVGVHARRGDYKEYLGGIHFHNWCSYRKWISQAKDLIEQNGRKKVGFLLCSDDHADTSFFADLPVHLLEEKSVMSDIHALSLCDFNLGPPSSFGTWSSWFGKVPRLHLQKGLKIRSLDQFSVCTSC